MAYYRVVSGKPGHLPQPEGLVEEKEHKQQFIVELGVLGIKTCMNVLITIKDQGVVLTDIQRVFIFPKLLYGTLIRLDY